MDVNDARLLELVPEIVAFAGALANAGKHGEATVLHGDVVDELLDHDGLTYAGTAKYTSTSSKLAAKS